MSPAGLGRSDVEYIFTPTGSTRQPLDQYLRDVFDRRAFIRTLAQAQLRSSQAGTALGEIWGTIDPLFQALIYYFLYTVIRSGVRTIDQLTIIIGCVFLFNVTRIILGEGGRSIITGKGLMLNSTFPRALLPATATYKALIEFRLAIPIYLLFHIALGAPFGPGLALLPLLFALQLAISTGFALLLCTATVKVRDISNLLQYVLRILVFVSPVIYPYELLSDTLRTILMVNPFFALFASYQIALGGGVPSPGLVFQSMCWAVFAVWIGLRLFRRHEHSFALYL